MKNRTLSSKYKNIIANVFVNFYRNMSVLVGTFSSSDSHMMAAFTRRCQGGYDRREESSQDEDQDKLIKLCYEIISKGIIT